MIKFLPLKSSFLLALLFASQTLAEETVEHSQWRQIELTIFTVNSQTASTAEIWDAPEQVQFTAPDNAVTIEMMPTKSPNIAYQQLAPELIADQAVFDRLKHSGRYRVLYQAAWRQPITAKEQSTPVFIQGGKLYGESYEMEGVIDLHVSRYLHFEADIMLTEFTRQENPSERSPYWTNSGAESGQNPADPLSTTSYMSTSYTPTRVYRLHESRRMRSGERHYLDHPVLGLVVLVHKTDD